MFSWLFRKAASPGDLLDLDKALDSFRRGNFKEALTRADAILAAQPEVAMSWRFKGECLFSLERYGKAAKCFDKAEQIGGPGTEDVFLWKALSLYNGGEREQARRTLHDFLMREDADQDLVDKARNALREFGVST